MTILPASIRNLLSRRNPQPPRCTDDNVNALLGRIISHENNSPPHVFDQLVSDELRKADDIARRGEGE